jgi:microbial collagenase
MLGSTRTGDWAAYKARLNNWAVDYDAEFTQWTQLLANGGGTGNEAPVVVINGPYTANKAELINFSSQGSFDKESTIESFNWQFGDGNTSSEANPTHSYGQAGEYTVTLTATDTDGASRTESTMATILGDTTPTNQLKNGESKAISGVQDSVLRFTLVVPEGASNLNFALNGGTGDADLYLKFGAAPSMTDYDCRPYLGGNNETCEISNVQAGTYYVMVYGYNSFDTTIIASFNVGSGFNVPNACALSGPITGGRLYDGQVRCLAEQDTIWLSLENVKDQNSIAITTANGTGDLSLEYSNGSWPNGNNVDATSTNSGNGECIYITNQNQYWGYLKVSGYAQGASIVVDYNTPSCR